MAKIEIRFGNLVPPQFEEILNKRAIDWNCSFEFTFLESFKYLVENTLLKRKKGDNYFDLAFLIALDQSVKAPKAKFDTYLNKSFKLPMIVLSSDYLTHIPSKEKIFIEDGLIDIIGNDFEGYFDYEYVGFVRR